MRFFFFDLVISQEVTTFADMQQNLETLNFVRQHADDDVRLLALQGRKHPGVDMAWALDQIAGRRTARTKLPTWAQTEGIVYPHHLAMEQCSSEPTARYKAELAGSGRLMADLTGGFGVDFSFMARLFDEAIYVERQTGLCEVATSNFRLLGLNHAQVVCDDGADFLRQTERHFDLIYLDPARRDSHGGRTYGISDCEPDLTGISRLLTEKADRVVAKLSPMLDWRKAVADVGSDLVAEVHIVSVGNECKEMLLVMKREAGPLRVVCVNDGQRFEYWPDDEVVATACGKTPVAGDFLYEPNASIMKAGCFAYLSESMNLKQIAVNSHLYVSEAWLPDFPGRRFTVDTVLTMNKRELRNQLKGLTQANVTVRNFPLTVADLRRRLKLSEGGSTFIFATTLANGNHILLITHRP